MPKNKRSFGSDLKKIDAHVIQPHEYDEAPEWTAEDFAKAEIRVGNRLIRAGRPRLGDPKVPVAIRLDSDVLKSYRDLGPGWQTKLNADLRRIRKLPPRVTRKAAG